MNNAVAQAQQLIPHLRLSLILIAAIVLQACSSSGPATKFYALFSPAELTLPATVKTQQQGLPSIGVGPITLPGYLDNSAIISRNTTQQINVSGYHVWAEALDIALSRVLAENLSKALDHDDIWHFPWDTRDRPRYQISLVFSQLDGQRDDAVNISAKWRIYDQQRKKMVGRGAYTKRIDVNGDGYDNYVLAINQAVNQLSIVLAESVSTLTQ